MCKFNRMIHEIDFSKAFLQIIYFYEHSKLKNRIAFLLRSIISIVFMKIKFNHNNDSTYDYFIFKSMPKRRDYDLIYYNVFKLIEGKKLSFQYEKSFAFNWGNIWSFFTLLLSDRKKYNLPLWLFIVVSAVKCTEVIRLLSDTKFKNLVVFADMQFIDNFLVQYYKNRKVNTITLQHALYFEVKEKESVNFINYKNVVSDYFLAWGQHTKDLISKYNKDVKIIICGKPVEKDNIIGKDIEIKEEFFSIVLDFDEYHSHNQVMIDIGKRIADIKNYKVNLRFHPRSLRNYNIPNAFYIDKNLVDSKFIIGHKTTLLYELMSCEYPVYFLVPRINKLATERLDVSNYDEIISSFFVKGSLCPSNYYINSIDLHSKHMYSQYFKNLI